MNVTNLRRCQYRLCTAFAACAVVAALSLPLPTGATVDVDQYQGHADPGGYEQRTERSKATLRLGNGNEATKKVAFERFRFAQWFAIHEGGWPICKMVGDYERTVLFPLGRSDRAYVLLLPDYLGSPVTSKLMCFQWKNGKYHLVYQITLQNEDRVVTKKKLANDNPRSVSLFDFVTKDNVGSIGNVEHAWSNRVRGSRFALHDLKEEGDYVRYDYDITGHYLTVSLISRGDWEEFYQMGTDPLTGSSLNEGKYTKEGYFETTWGKEEFYKKYGLPVTHKELGLFPLGYSAGVIDLTKAGRTRGAEISDANRRHWAAKRVTVVTSPLPQRLTTR